MKFGRRIETQKVVDHPFLFVNPLFEHGYFLVVGVLGGICLSRANGQGGKSAHQKSGG